MKTKKLLTISFFLLALIFARAQTPDFYPPVDPEPVQFDLFNIVLYIILPIVLVVGYLLYRRYKKKKKNK